jgi:fructose-1-phosphate kinase PfkB-like protein
LDAAGPALSEALPARPYLVKINREEALSLTDTPNEGASPTELLANVLSKGASNAIITNGRRGWNACIGGRFLKCSIEPNVRGFDVGAGDAMLAGLACGLSNGLTMDDTLHFASRLAAASTFIRGAGDVLLEEVDRPRGCLIEDQMDR